MTPDDALRDFFRELGLEHVTPFHVRALDAYRRQVEAMGVGNRPAAIADAFSGDNHNRNAARLRVVGIRLQVDLAFLDLDALHGAAQWDDAEWTAHRSARIRRNDPTDPLARKATR